MLEHGGRLREAAARTGRPLADWVDLSTGINPHGWPVPPLPADCWQRLPEAGDGLEDAMAAYYGNPDGLPVAGSQAALQWLPHLLPRAAVACLAPLYAEHPQAWQRAGHKVRFLQHATLPRALAAATPYVLLCNPNNPTAGQQSPETVLAAAHALRQRGGWLIIDEAFIDPVPAFSVTPLAGTAEAPNLIVFRSLGKFFGLAGARVGTLFAAADLRHRLTDLLGPWPLSHPARHVARLALADTAWQAAARAALAGAASRLADLLRPLGDVHATALFASLTTPQADEWGAHFETRGLLVRRFDQLPLLRIGLPADEAGWERLAAAIAEGR